MAGWLDVNIKPFGSPLRSLRGSCRAPAQPVPGEEVVSPFLLKCPEVVAWMHRVIIATWRGGRAPDSWRHALLVALWKGKGTRLLGDN
jgi:hypothetical protein